MTSILNNPVVPKDRQFLLYMAGVEIPATSASVSFGTFRFPEITVDVPPDPLLHRIGADDRIPLTLFYQDHWAYSKPTYCLLAEGEVTGWGYQRTGSSRSITFQAIDPMAILTSLFLFYISDVDSALNNSTQTRKSQDSGKDITLNSLPLNFFYKFLQTSGDTVKRPIDILLNVIGSVTGFVGGLPTYSKSRQLQELVNRTATAATTNRTVQGIDIYQQARKIVDRGVASPQLSKEGPTFFSSPGLVRFVAKQVGITLPGPSAQAIFDFCNEKKTTTTAGLARNIQGALLFESPINDPQAIDSVSIIGPDEQAISVLLSNQKVEINDSFRIAHDQVAKHESLGNPGLTIVDRFGRTGKPAGLAVGLIQHNQRVGTLFEICERMRFKNSKKFEAIMGGPAGISMFFNKATFRFFPFWDNTRYWYPRFAALFSDPEFIEVQYAFDREKYYNPVLPIAQKYKVDSQRGIVMLMDAAVQMGVRNATRLMAKAVKAVGGLGSNTLKKLTKFAYLADRFGINPGKTWKRRARILASPNFSDASGVLSESREVTVRAGIRQTALQSTWRKPVAYALIPGVDYSKSAPPGTISQDSATLKADKTQLDPTQAAKARISELNKQKNKKIKEILRRDNPGRTKFTAQQEQAALKAFTKENPKHAARVASAKRTAQAQASLKRNLKRAQVAIQFFMRWMQKTKLKQHIVASPILEEVGGEGEGIFPVLAAMKRENVARALVSFSQSSSGRAGSLWDFLRQIYQIGLWELGFIIAPPAVITDENHVIKSRLEGATGGRPTIASYVSKPNMYFGLPPAANVMFPSMLESVQFQENYATQPTRTYIDDTTMASKYGIDKKNDAFNYFATAKAAFPPEADAALHNAPQKNKNNKDLVVFPEELYKGPVTNRHKTPTWFYYLHRHNSKDRRGNAKRQRTDDSGVPAPVVKVITGKNTADGSLHGTRGAIYKRGGVTYVVPYANDKKTTSKAPLFSQVGYWRGKPIRFNATNVEGKILHAEAAKSYIRLKAELKKVGIDVSILEGFRTMSEQVAKTDGTRARRPGYARQQAGISVKLAVSANKREKLKDFLLENGLRLGFAPIDFVDLIIESTKAKTDVQQASRNAAQASVTLGKGIPLFVQTTLPPAVYDILYAKNARRSTRQNDPEHETYFKYAKFEHFREKYSSRTASASGVFNPYIIAGYPGYIFDNDGTNFHLAGTVVSGTHRLSNAGGSGTQVNMTFARTFHEMFEEANIERNGFPIGPVDPIEVVSDATQRIPNARRYYKQLLYGNQDFRGQDPLGDYQNILGWARADAPPDRIVAEPTKTGFNLNTQLNREIQALPQARRYFDDTNAALSYCSRPVCTIDEYIQFYLGVNRTAAHPGDKINHNGSLDMKFYYQIRNFDYGQGIVSDPTEFGITKKEMHERLAALPPTLRDWQSALLLYRQKIYANQTGV